MKTALPLKDTFTSTGHKFFAHQETMRNLRNGKGQPVVTHLMPTSVCAHSCAFCSVHHRPHEVLPLADMTTYLDILLRYGLKAVIISGGGNPILYRCPDTGADFNRLVDEVYRRGLEIGVISDGMPLRVDEPTMRQMWKAVHPETIDKLTWLRISMAGLDHQENCVHVPDVDPSRTTLGFSYVLHDIYDEPADKAHGKVSTPADLITVGYERLHNDNIKPVRFAEDRVPVLTSQIDEIVRKYKPTYVRLLPNCLQPELIQQRCDLLQRMADAIDPDVVFVQYKPPAAPNVCLLGSIHPVLNTDGFCYPCDSCVLNDSAGHKFANPWRMCHWSEIASIYERPLRSLIDNPHERCPGCVFTQSNLLLEKVWKGEVEPTPPVETPEHVNFV